MSKLKKYLMDNSETQESFAARTSMTQGNVAKLCRDNALLSIETALKVEEATSGFVRVEDWPTFAALSGRKHPSPLMGSH